MSELVYYTRKADEQGKYEVWVFRGQCPECKKGLMGKPINPKTKKVMSRADTYVCPECNFSIDSDEYRETLTASIAYTCAKCKYSGEMEKPFKRKKVSILNPETGKKKRKTAFLFNCEKCGFEFKVVSNVRGAK